MSTAISDILHRFTQDNLIEAQYALTVAKNKYGSNRSSYNNGGAVVIDSNPRHNKTSETTISMSDYDQNNANAVVVLGTTGNDVFANHGYASFIWGNDGNDKIRNHKSDVTISGGAGNDSIRISGDPYAPHNNSLSGGSGDDTITIQIGYATENPTNVTIIGGTGDDYIDLPSRGTTYRDYHGDYILQYKNGDGDDTVVGRYKFDTLYIEGNDYSTQKSGDDVLVKVGSGSILFKSPVVDSTGQIYIETVPAGTFGTSTTSGGGNDTTSSGGNDTTSGGGEDTVISNSQSYKKISGTSYADYIYNDYGADYVTINGGEGNDTIDNLGDTVKIDTGAGKDSIYSYSYYSTIKPGTGNDTVSLHASGHHNVIQYASGDGNDKIYNLGSTDTLSITGGKYSSVTSGSNVIITVGSSKITLVGAKGNTLNIKGTLEGGSSGKVITNSTSNKKISGTSYADTIYNYGSRASINGGKGNDELVSFDDGSRVTLTGGAGKDSIYSWSAYSKLNGGDGADYLYAGNNNHMTVLGGAGNDTVINYGSYNSILGGSDNDSISNTSIGYYSTLNGGAGADKIYGDSKKDTIIGGTGNDTLWGGSGADKFIYARGDGKDIIYGFDNKDTLTFDNITFKTSMASYSKSKGTITFNVSGGSITLKDFTASTFHVNNSTYKISGSKLVKK